VLRERPLGTRAGGPLERSGRRLLDRAGTDGSYPGCQGTGSGQLASTVVLKHGPERAVEPDLEAGARCQMPPTPVRTGRWLLRERLRLDDPTDEGTVHVDQLVVVVSARTR
jgi:hypothetical protein